MEQVDLLLHARWIVPVVPRGQRYENHALAVRDGRILAIVPSEDAVRRFLAKESVYLRQHVLIPGLINVHTHAAMTLFRGLSDDLPLKKWLAEVIWPREQRFVDPDFVRVGTELAIAEMLLSGITCFNDMYFFPNVTAQVVKRSGIRATLGLIFVDFPTPWAEKPEEYFAKNLHLLEENPPDEQLQWVLAPHAPYSVGDGTLEKVARLSERLSLKVHIHLHETAHEIEESLAEHRVRPLERLDQLGLFNDRLISVHMTQLLDGEIEELAKRGVSVVHCPQSNLKLTSGIAPVAYLDQAGVTVALGTDGAASNNDLDLFGEMQTAALLAKGVTLDPTALPAERVLEMATIEGARALGREQEIGSLQIGKLADIVAVDLRQPATFPIYDPVSQLVYAASRAQVTDVWVGGKQLVRSGKLTMLDWEGIAKEALRWQKVLMHQ